SIPAGLSFNTNGAQLTISGTPTATGTVNFSVIATDESGDQATQNYALTVNADTPALTFSPTTVPSGNVNTAYDQIITASGGSGGVTVSYSLTSGSFPNGLTPAINGNTLTISGTPTATGSVGFNVIATDSSGHQATQSYTLNINAAGITINFSPTTVPSGNVNTAYNQAITASGGSGGVTVTDSITSGTLPNGLTITGSGTNQLTISGTPTVSGSVTFSVIATDSDGNQATQNYTLTVNPAGATILLSPSSLPSGTAGTGYSQAITASGGVGALSVTYHVTSGSVPTGLLFAINGNQLTINGTPTVAGSAGFSVTATDTSGDTTTHNYILTVSSSVSPPSPPSPPVGPTFGTATNIASISNSFAGLTMIETVVAQVTNSNGTPLSQGFVTLDVFGQSVLAPVSNGTASVTVAVGVLDFSLLMDLFFSSALTLSYNDAGGAYGSSATSTTVPPILLDFYLFLLAEQFGSLNQLQT
ncbi:MAG: putative Ig domain-containing protein, partial [Gemmataceae bacterium]